MHIQDLLCRILIPKAVYLSFGDGLLRYHSGLPLDERWEKLSM